MTPLPRRTFLKTTAAAVATLPWIANDAQHAKTSAAPKTLGVSIHVRDMGATGDGKTKDTLALQQSLDRCSLLGGGEVVLSAGEYLSGALQIHSNTTLRMEEGATLSGSPDMQDYPLAQVRWEGKFIKGYSAFLNAVDATNIRVTGPGRIIGSSAIVGRLEKGTRMRLPALLEFTNCRNVTVDNIFTKQYGMWSIHPVLSDDVTFRNVTIESGADGIDPDSCRNVIIDNCTFRTVDDCIAIKSGRGSEAYRMARPSENIHISNCTFTDARWACVSIGSEASGGVRNVVVEHCKILSAYTHGVYIKTRSGRGAFIEDITFRDIDVSGCREGFLRLNSLGSGLQDQDPVPGDEGLPQLRNLRFTDIRVQDVPQLVLATEIHPKKPLDGLVLANISGTCRKGMEIANATHVEIRNVTVTGFNGPLLSTRNVTGKGLAGAVELPASAMPKIPDEILPPATPYILK